MYTVWTSIKEISTIRSHISDFVCKCSISVTGYQDQYTWTTMPRLCHQLHGPSTTDQHWHQLTATSQGATWRPQSLPRPRCGLRALPSSDPTPPSSKTCPRRRSDSRCLSRKQGKVSWLRARLPSSQPLIMGSSSSVLQHSDGRPCLPSCGSTGRPPGVVRLAWWAVTMICEGRFDDLLSPIVEGEYSLTVPEAQKIWRVHCLCEWVS